MTTYTSQPRLDPQRSIAVIDSLGGTVATASLFGIASPSVSGWRRKGIPAARLQYIQMKYKKLPAVRATLDFRPWVKRA